MSPRFFDINNLREASRYVVTTGVMSAAMTGVIITGGIDLSVGSILGMSGIVLGFSWQAGLPLPVAVMVGVLAGALAGLLNGVCVVYGRIPPLIVTLATLALYRGVALAISKAASVTNFPAWFQFCGQGNPFGMPAQLPLLLIVLVVAYVILHRSRFGRMIYAIGDNEIAARFAAVPVNQVKLWLYTASGLSAGLAGLAYTAHANTAKADAGTGYELDVITCVVLGGTQITGGKGTILGTVLGLLIIRTMIYGMHLLAIKTVVQTIAIGAVLITTAVLNQYVEVWRERKRTRTAEQTESPSAR
jgi:rhamnose transport system permease protein